MSLCVEGSDGVPKARIDKSALKRPSTRPVRSQASNFKEEGIRFLVYKVPEAVPEYQSKERHEYFYSLVYVEATGVLTKYEEFMTASGRTM